LGLIIISKMSWWGGGMVGRIYATQFYSAEIQSIPPAPNWPCGCTRPASAWRQANLSVDAYQNLKPYTNFINSFVHITVIRNHPAPWGCTAWRTATGLSGTSRRWPGPACARPAPGQSGGPGPLFRPVLRRPTTSPARTLRFLSSAKFYKNGVHVSKFTNSFSYSNPTVIWIFCRNVSFWRNERSFMVNRPRWFQIWCLFLSYCSSSYSNPTVICIFFAETLVFEETNGLL